MTGKNVELTSRPVIVGNAVKLLYAALGIGVLRAVLEFPMLAQQVPVAYILFVWAVIFGVMWYLIREIGSRQNWARILWLILFIVALPLSFGPLIHALLVTPIPGLLGVLQVSVQVIALVMLFQRASNEWFRKSEASE